jgi:hypothetical protein
MKNSVTLFLILFLLSLPLSLCFPTTSLAQSMEIKGQCSVNVNGANTLTINGAAPKPADGGKKSYSTNILWQRSYFAELKAKKPEGASIYDNMLRAAENGGVFALNCADKNGYLSISSLGYDLQAEEFVGKVGAYTLVGSNSKNEQPPGFMTGLVASQNGAMLALSPDKQPGQLAITKFTDTEIAGSYEFTAKGNNVSGSFEFERVEE